MGNDGAIGGESGAVKAAKDILFGGIAGMVSKVFEHPFDLTKVRLQAQVLDATARFNGPLDCLYKTWRYEGFRGLYRGLPAPVTGAMAENASLFLSYRELQNVIRNLTGRDAEYQLPLGQLMIAATGAGVITSFILTPVELVKCKMQVQQLAIGQSSPLPAGAAAASAIGGIPSPTNTTHTARKPPGPIAVLASIIRTTGVRGLWLGQTGTLIRESGGGAAWFSTKEYVADKLVRKRLRDQGLPTDPVSVGSHMKHLKAWESAVSGACAGAMFNFVMFPADTVKSTMQTEEELRPASGRMNGGPKATFWGTFREIYGKGGIRGLYAGCGITVARSIPSSAIIFLTFDGLTKYFG
ncbi:mitochondrial carrier [Macrolepiota fuliginosa MF-IS2]|uniref:Mitochondrial carrier n=1 Tax=Macrolepiota fuliginosa MF-IS2 TaxID=1400762 RepID=A0A9P5X5C3_9AGAR|nr:mitochondrial carrier [Macrolepiota fuliginosa MF-IS2]